MNRGGDLHSDLPGFGLGTPESRGSHYSLFDHGIVQIILQVFQMVYAVCIWFFLSHLFDIDLLVMQFILTFFASLCGVSVILYSLVHLVLDALICGVDVLCDAFEESWKRLSDWKEKNILPLSLKVSAQSTSLAYKLGKDDRREVSDDIDETTPSPPISTSFATIPLPTTLFTRRWEFPGCASIKNFEFDIDFDVSKDNKDEKEENILLLESIDTAPRKRKSLMTLMKIRRRFKKKQSTESDCRRVRNELCIEDDTAPTPELNFDSEDDGSNDDGRVGLDANNNGEEEDEAQPIQTRPRKRKRAMDLLSEEASPVTNAKRHCRRVGNQSSNDDETTRAPEFHFDREDDALNDDGRAGLDGNNDVQEEAQPMQTRHRKRKRAMDLLLEEAAAFTNASLLGFGAGSTTSSSGQRRSLRLAPQRLAPQSQIALGSGHNARGRY